MQEPIHDLTQAEGGSGTTALMRFGLKQKIIAYILAAGAVPLILGMVLAYSQGTTELERVIGGNFQALAGETAHSIDLVLDGEIVRRTRIATNDTIIRALTTRNHRYEGLTSNDVAALLSQETARWVSAGSAASERPSSPAHLSARLAQDTLDRFARTQGMDQSLPDRSALRALFLTDAQGALVVSIGPKGYPDYRQSDQGWWRGAFNEGRGRIYLGNVAFDDRLNTYVFTLAIPVLDESGQRVRGILQSVYDAKQLFKPVIHPVRFGKTGHVMLIDTRGTVIICPILPTGVRVNDTALVKNVTGKEPGWVKAAGDGHGGQATSIIGFAPLQETSRITTASTGLLWHSFAWQASEEIFAPTRSLLIWIASAGLLAIGMLGSIGYYAAHRIITPIRRLQEGAARIGRGELNQPLTIKTNDEIEQLADEFNSMSAMLERAFTGLGDQVAAKTAEVRYLKEYNEKILNSLPDSVIILREDRTIEYLNGEAVRTLSVPSTDIIDQDLFQLLRVDPQTQQRITREFQQVRSPVNGGTASPQEPRLGQSRDPLAPTPAGSTVESLGDLRVGDRVFGHRFFLVSAAGRETTRIGLALREVTAERQLQDQLIQAEKLAGMGTLTAGIAHEINNPLFVIMGLAEGMEDETDLRVTQEYAKDIVKHAQHMASVIKNFARYTAHGAPEAKQFVDVNQKLSDALKMAKLGQVSDDLEVTTEYQSVAPVMARPEEIQQVFLNIIVNAIQAMEGHGALRLVTEQMNGRVQVRIADKGPGIPKAYLAKIFDPFFTTKEPGKGTGLGLNIAYQIVTKYGGTIHVDSEEGKGTEFTIRLPAETTA